MLLNELVSYRLIRVTKLHRERISTLLDAIGLHVGQELALLHLDEDNGIRQADLAALLGVEPPTVTKVLKHLEEEGFIQRERDAEDVRAYRVRLTRKGAKARVRAEACWREIDRGALRGLSASERDALEALLVRLEGNLSSSSAPQPT